jgi:response regulator RpfG family c-di-GMP phosphodiesterase
MFYNEPAMEGPMFRSFVEKLRDYAIVPRNMVAYMSNSLSIFAINYAREVTAYDAAVLNSIVMQTLFLKSLSAQIQETEDAFEYTVQSLARASEVNDEDTGKHIVRVGLYSALLARALDQTDAFVQDIRLQALLHDVGKIHIPPVVLKKPDELSAGEWFVMKQHALLGARIIGAHPRLRMAKTIALTHHEKWDGTGYPNRLYKEAIPLEGRIVAIADIYDAIRNARIYKEAYNHKDTCDILTNGDDRTLPKHFDPAVLKVFTDMTGKFEEVYETYNG